MVCRYFFVMISTMNEAMRRTAGVTRNSTGKSDDPDSTYAAGQSKRATPCMATMLMVETCVISIDKINGTAIVLLRLESLPSGH